MKVTPQEFRSYLFTRGLSSRTMGHLANTYKRLADAQALSQNGFFSYLEGLRGLGRSQACLNKHIQCIRHYLKMTDQTWDHLPTNFTEDARTKQVFTATEIHKLINCGGKPLYSTLFLLLATSGLRIGEALKLTMEDVSESQRLLTIKNTKTSRDRQIPINSLVLEKLLALKSGVRLFPLTSQAVNDELRRRCNVLRIKYRSAYTFRHSAITRWIENGTPVFVVQKLAGHGDLKTTQNYFHLGSKHMREAIESDPLSYTSMDVKSRFLTVTRSVLDVVDAYKHDEMLGVVVKEEDHRLTITIERPLLTLS